MAQKYKPFFLEIIMSVMQQKEPIDQWRSFQ